MPAMPCQSTSEGYACNYDIDTECKVPTGLTKREMFSMHALHTIMSSYNPYEYGDFDSSDYDETVKHAVGIADALLAELDK